MFVPVLELLITFDRLNELILLQLKSANVRYDTHCEDLGAHALLLPEVFVC